MIQPQARCKCTFMIVMMASLSYKYYTKDDEDYLLLILG
jgi:hypothetical protein